MLISSCLCALSLMFGDVSLRSDADGTGLARGITGLEFRRGFDLFDEFAAASVTTEDESSAGLQAGDSHARDLFRQRLSEEILTRNMQDRAPQA